MLFFCGQRWICQDTSGKPPTGRFSNPPFRIHFFMINKNSNILFRILLNFWWAEMDSTSRVGKTVHRTLFESSFSNPFFYEKQKSNILFRILLNSWWQRWIRQAASGKPSTGRFFDPPFRIHFFMRNKKSNILFRILLNSWWAEMDSNHRTLTRTDLQSAAFSHSAICPFSHLKK